MARFSDEEVEAMWGDRADGVRLLVKGEECVWVDKGSEAETDRLADGWKGDDGSKKPSEAPAAEVAAVEPVAALAAEPAASPAKRKPGRPRKR